MPIKRYKPEQIVNLLRQIEVGIANGKTTPQACKEAEITQQTYYRWRKEYGGLKLDQVTHDGRALRLLVVLDEYTRECLAIRVARRLGSAEVIEVLAEAMLWRGIPAHIRSDTRLDVIHQ